MCVSQLKRITQLITLITVPTTDGSLEIEFSVVETGRSFEGTDLQQILLQNDICNPSLQSSLSSGLPANVQTTLVASHGVFEDGRAPEFNLLPGEKVTPIVSYCDYNTGTLWWRVRNQFDRNWLDTGKS